jgi:AraC-like DNA-binding protein
MLEQPGATVPLTRHYEVLEAAADALGDRLMGARMTESWQVEDFEELGFLLYTSATLGDALSALLRFRALWTTAETLTLEVRGATTRLEWWPCGPSRRAHAICGQLYAADTILGSGKLLGEPLAVERIDLPGESLDPPARCALEAMLGAPVRSGAEAAVIHLATAQLALPLPSADAKLAEFFARQVSAQARLRDHAQTSATRLKQYLHLRLSDAPSLEDASQALAMSPRTLQRALAAEETSFRQALDEVRSAEATRLIERGVALEEAARLLGFGEERALWRAFQRWYGMSPARWRSGRRD